MPGLFGPFRVRVDPWEVDYGSETPLEPIGDEPDEDVVLDIEDDVLVRCIVERLQRRLGAVIDFPRIDPHLELAEK